MGEARMTKLVRIITETRTYVEVGEAHSSHQHYWEKDFKAEARYEIKEPEVTTIDELREPTLSELALFNKHSRFREA